MSLTLPSAPVIPRLVPVRISVLTLLKSLQISAPTFGESLFVFSITGTYFLSTFQQRTFSSSFIQIKWKYDYKLGTHTSEPQLIHLWPSNGLVICTKINVMPIVLLRSPIEYTWELHLTKAFRIWSLSYQSKNTEHWPFVLTLDPQLQRGRSQNSLHMGNR